MRACATAKIKIQTTPEILNTLNVYRKALQFCVDKAWETGIKTNFNLHRLVYPAIRERFKLPAQLAVGCIKQACGYVKRAKSKPTINKACIRYNFPRSAGLNGNILSLRLLSKREQFHIAIPDCYKRYFGWDTDECLLRLDKKGKTFFLFTFSKEVQAQGTSTQTRVLGLDFGINNLVVSSDNRFFNSSQVKQAKRKFRHLRSVLQAKGTRSSRRLLRAISGRETRYVAWINHNISKIIVASCDVGDRIVMENLKGIRKQRRGKRFNYWISNWSFYQLQSFVEYKATHRGIAVERVNPAYTSQICHRCGQLGVRNRGEFSCQSCGLFHFNSDLNASRNLAHPKLVERQAVVTQPYSPNDDAKASVDELRLSSGLKAPNFS